MAGEYLPATAWGKMSTCKVSLFFFFRDAGPFADLVSKITLKKQKSGPNWIHGTDNNPILPLSEISSSKLHHFSEACPVYDFDGRLLNQAEADELQDLLWKVIERAVEYSKYCYSAIPVEKSFFDYCVEKAEELFGPNEVEDESPKERAGVFSGGGRGGVKRSGEEHIRWKGEEERKKEIWLSMAEMWGTFIGSPVTRQSLKFFFLEEPLEGGEYPTSRDIFPAILFTFQRFHWTGC